MDECKCGHEHATETKVEQMMKLVRAANDIYDTLTQEEKIIVDGNLADMEIGAEH